MVKPQLSWSDRIKYSLTIERESDAFGRDTETDPERMYWTRDDVERLHSEIAQRLLRIVDPVELESLGSAALTQASFVDGSAVPQDLARIVAAAIRPTLSDTPKPVRDRVLDVSTWYQVEKIAAADMVTYAIIGETFRVKGAKLELLYVREPRLDEFQRNIWILPPVAYFQTACDWVHQQLTVADNLPPGRI